MGKTNKPNRTKGNTRPSSSGHSAQLLTLSGKPLSGFIGFDALEKEVSSYVPVTGQHVSDTPDSSVDSDFRMVMRKLLKKDCVTRLKAIQEFRELCDEKDKDIVKKVLPFWPRLFNKLALDSDRRIREATHQANNKLILKVKRDIAPFLKSIMGVWLLGQCDLYAPAASAAQAAFTSIFPLAKQSEALIYCKSEIFAYYKDNLFEQTAKSLSESNPASEEEIENKYVLVISCTFQAMRLFLMTILPSEVSNVADDYRLIVMENKFWKYAKNKDAQIRAAWYSLVSSFCLLNPDIFSEIESKITVAVFGCLSENDPVVATSVWEAALHITMNFKNCWQGIDVHKVVLPQLYTFLKEGGKGNAHVLFPCLLPFLSKLPKEIIEKESFQLQFFSHMRNSLKLEGVKNSYTECDAVLTALMECLQYLCCNILDDLVAGPALLRQILINEVLPLFELSLYDNKHSYIATSKFHSLLSSLAHGVEKKFLKQNKEQENKFADVLILFWENVNRITSKFFEKESKDIDRISVFLAEFIYSMVSSSSSVIQRQKFKVRFQDDDKSGDDDDEHIKFKTLFSLNTTHQNSILALGTKSHFVQFAISYSKLLCQRINTDVRACYLKLLNAILSSTLNKEILLQLLNELSFVDKCELVSSVAFFQDMILKWVQKANNDSQCISYIADIIFSVGLCVSESEALGMLSCCCELGNAVLLHKLLTKGLKVYEHLEADERSDEPFKKWLKSPMLIATIVNGFTELLDELLIDENSNLIQKDTLQLYFTGKILQGTLVETNNIETVLLICKNFVERCLKNGNVTRILSPVCEVTISIILNCKACWNYIAIDDLLSVFFYLKINQAKHGFSAEFSELSEVWQTAVISSVQVRRELTTKDNFILRSAVELHNSVFQIKNAEELQELLVHTLNFLQIVREAMTNEPNTHSTPFVLSEFLEKILPSDEDWKKLKDGLTLNILPLFLENKLFYPLPDDDSFSIPVIKVYELSLVSQLISSIFVGEINNSSSNEDEQYFERYSLKQLPHLLWCLTYCVKSGCDVRIKEELKRVSVVDKLEDDFSKILSFLPFDKVRELIKEVFILSLHQGSFWAPAFKFLLKAINDYQLEYFGPYSNFIDEAHKSDSKSQCLVIQVLIYHFFCDEKILLSKSLLLELSEKLDSSSAIVENFGKVAELCCLAQDKFVMTSFEIQSLLLSIIPKIINFSCQFEGKMKLQCTLQMSALLASMVQYAPHIVSSEIWDYFISLLKTSMKEGQSLKECTPDGLLLWHKVFSLFCSLSLFINIHSTKEPDTSSTTEISWKPTICSEIYEDFILLFIHITDFAKNAKLLPKEFEILMTNLMRATEFIPRESVFEFLVLQKDTDKDLKEIQKTGDKICSLESLISSLVCNVRQLQFATHSMLLKVIPLLPSLLLEAQSSDDDDDDPEEKIPTKLQPLIDLLHYTNEVVENMLLEVKIGDCCTVIPYTDSYAFATAYLLAWLEILEFISSSPSQVRSGYVAHLEETKLLSSLFSNVFRLMPENPASCLKSNKNEYDEYDMDTPKKENFINLFLGPLELSSGPPSSEEMQTIACFVFSNALRRVPASIRIWWNNLDKRSADIVNKFTSKYISGILCAEEIQAVHDHEKQFENMVVKARPGSREVIASYTIDDSTIELCVQLPSNFPLGPITAERRGKIIIAQQEWRLWLMQLTTVLTYQNGSILDGLNIWKKNLDKKFEGVEECMICYYILHSSTLKLPRLSCHVCRKKFHSACLYKWFRSSNNFTCPLCRNEFAI